MTRARSTPEAAAADTGRRQSSGVRWARLATRISNAFGLVLLLVAATYVVMSLISYSGWSAAVLTAIGCSAGVSGLAAAGVGPVFVRTAAALAAGSVTLAIVGAFSEVNAFLAIAALTQTCLLAWASAAVLRAVIGESEVGFRTILGAISVYMIFGVLFASVYVSIDRLQSGDFFTAGPPDTGDFIFFSFTTLTTTGYGDLVPAEQPGKMFAGLEMLLGQIFLVTLIAGLVSLWRPQRRSERSD